MRGNLQAATSWREQCGLKTSDDDLSYLREREYLTLARVYIAEERAHPSALRLQDICHMLDRRLQDAEAKARGSSVLELLLLQSLAFAAQGERNAAFAALFRALSLAEPEGYVRLFVDQGTPMRELLRQAASRRITPRYVATLLAAIGSPAEDIPASPAYPDGLTVREVEVLRLVTRGLTYAQIAKQLVVSTRTVDAHLRSIYSKLDVTSRTAATRYAIEHKLV
jgi:LuxR family maltose regulon positive regulatory protein